MAVPSFLLSWIWYLNPQYYEEQCFMLALFASVSKPFFLPCPICPEFWREGQQGQPGGFGWQRESVQNGSCRRTSEGRQQHKQVRHWHMQVAELDLVRITVVSLASSLGELVTSQCNDRPPQKQLHMALSAALCWAPCVSLHWCWDPDSCLTQMRAVWILSGKSDSSTL